jgi:hypothetical protein
MRSFLQTGHNRPRSERLREKYRSRFKDGGSRSGNRALRKFRRNRQLIAKELTSTILWLALAFMMVPLGRSLWRVSVSHLAGSSALWRFGLPAVAALGLIFCLWRARIGWREFKELRQEQRQLLEVLRREDDDQAPA